MPDKEVICSELAETMPLVFITGAEVEPLSWLKARQLIKQQRDADLLVLVLVLEAQRKEWDDREAARLHNKRGSKK